MSFYFENVCDTFTRAIKKHAKMTSYFSLEMQKEKASNP